jgi:hypothetical protein
MRRFTTIPLALLALGAFAFVGGCESMGGHSEGHMHKPSPNAMAGTPTDNAMACSKCDVVFVKSPETNQKGRVVGYSQKQQMVCPDCKSHAENFFSTGKMEHTCSSCGGNMMGCAMH